MTNTERAGTAVRSIAALAAVVVVVPLGLVAASRARFGSANPLVEIAPPWRWSRTAVRDSLTEPLRDDAVVNFLLRGCLVVAWVALAIIVVTTIVELVHLTRHHGIPAPRVRGLGWAQRTAHFIAAGLVVMLPISSSAGVATGSGNVLEKTRTIVTTPAAAAPAAGDAVGPAVLRRPSSAAGITVEGRRDGPPDGVDTTGADQVASGSYVVRRGDSIWSIAARLATDGDDGRTIEIADAILDANLGRTMNDGSTFTNPALIRVGWSIVLPAETHDGTTLPPPSAGTGTGLENGPTAQHVVEPGETLSSIAAEHLDDPDRWPEIFESNIGRTMPDGRALADADLILPGWTVDVPTGGTAPGTSSPAPDDTRPGTVDDFDGDGETTDAVTPTDAAASDRADGDQTGTASDDRRTDGDADTVDETTDSATPTDPAATGRIDVDVPDRGADGAVDAPEVATTVGDITPLTDGLEPPTTTGLDNRLPPPTLPTPSTSTTTTTTPLPVDGGGADTSQATGTESPAAPSPLRLEHAAFLAAGVLALVGVRRRRRLRAALPRARVPEPRADVAAIERRLRSLAPGEVAMRLDIALRAAAHSLADQQVGIGLIRLGSDGEVTLRLTGPGRLPDPWRGLGTDWELAPTVPIELLTDDARRSGAPCSALAEIGLDPQGRSVLVDVEVAGMTAVEAPADQADEVIRAITMSLASSLHAEVAHLIAVGLDEAVLLGHPNAHHRATAIEAVDLALALAGSTVDNERTTFDLRTHRTGGEMWEPAIVLLGSTAMPADPPTGTPVPGHGFGLVAATRRGGLPASSVRLTGFADHWELDAFGDRFDIDPIGIGVDDLTEVTTLLDDADSPIPAEPISSPTTTASTADSPTESPFTPRPHEIVVGLLGGVEVRSRNGELGRFERSKTVELIAWLATHRERSTRTAARTALWEIDVRDATFANVVSEARRALGRLVDPPDGEEWVARTLTESLPLHDHVVTDADLVRDRLDHARLAPPSHAIEVLRPAVEIIRDMPFAGTSYLWPDADGITSELVLLATTVTAELAAHALSLGDVDTVFWATGHGLRVLPGHEELIALRMRAHARTGDLAGVRAEWESYERVIVADAWSDGEPAPKLLDLRRELLSVST